MSYFLPSHGQLSSMSILFPPFLLDTGSGHALGMVRHSVPDPHGQLFGGGPLGFRSSRKRFRKALVNGERAFFFSGDNSLILGAWYFGAGAGIAGPPRGLLLLVFMVLILSLLSMFQDIL